MEFLNFYFFMSGAVTKSGIDNVIEGNGINLTILGMSVVFSGLLTMTIVLNLLEGSIQGMKKLIDSLSRTFAPKETQSKESGEREEQKAKISPVESKPAIMTGEEVVAICTALVLHHRMYLDTQKEILTWKGKGRLNTLSPWTLEGRIHPPPSRVKK